MLPLSGWLSRSRGALGSAGWYCPTYWWCSSGCRARMADSEKNSPGARTAGSQLTCDSMSGPKQQSPCWLHGQVMCSSSGALTTVNQAVELRQTPVADQRGEVLLRCLLLLLQLPQEEIHLAATHHSKHGDATALQVSCPQPCRCHHVYIQYHSTEKYLIVSSEIRKQLQVLLAQLLAMAL
jgi:hypothetical protein